MTPKDVNLYTQAEYAAIAHDYASILTQPVSIHECEQAFNNKFLKQLPENELVLLYDKKGLWLATQAHRQPLKMQANWLAQQKRVVNAGKKSELLLKAMKISEGMHIVDATAGMGHDSIVMAGRGAQVTMLEQQPLMYLLLTDAMQQVAQNANWHKLHARLKLHNTHAVEFFNQLQHTQNTGSSIPSIDAVYLDPMFPHDSYKSALVNKNMQILQTLAQPPSLLEEQQLLESALQVSKRVVVKRPSHAPFLAQREPHTQWHGDVIRFDGYTAV